MFEMLHFKGTLQLTTILCPYTLDSVGDKCISDILSYIHYYKYANPHVTHNFGLFSTNTS